MVRALQDDTTPAKDKCDTKDALKSWVKGWLKNNKASPYLPNLEMKDLLFPNASSNAVITTYSTTFTAVTTKLQRLDMNIDTMSVSGTDFRGRGG